MSIYGIIVHLPTLLSIATEVTNSSYLFLICMTSLFPLIIGYLDLTIYTYYKRDLTNISQIITTNTDNVIVI